MNEQRLIDLLNDCIDRLASGQTVEECLRAYPDAADDLRPLLQAGLLPRRAHAGSNEINAMRSRLDARIDAKIARTNFSSARLRVLPGMAVLLVASLIAFVIGVGIFVQRPDQDLAEQPLFADTDTPEATEEITREPEFTPEPLEDTIEEPTITPSVTAIPTETPTLTQTATEAPSATHTPTVTEDPVCTPSRPEGWAAYRVQSGDSVSMIAFQSGATVEELVQVNCIAEGRWIFAGQTLYVPHLWTTVNNGSDGSQPVIPTATAVSGAGSSSGETSTSAGSSGSDDSHDDEPDSDTDDHSSEESDD